jgi:outer membrane cobalamin receptor
LRKTLLYIIILFSLPLKGQLSFQDDTIKIKEVIISRRHKSFDISGYKKTVIDSSVVANYNHYTIAEILTANTGVIIKSYGPGGTATPSFRGTGANHTQLTWNGINMNHPMLGQSDFSLVPAGMIDDIQIYFGGASMTINAGGIGGIINLETKPLWKKETTITISPELGSYDRYSGLVKVKSGNIHFQTVTKALLQVSENDFRYLNTVTSSVPVWETRTNNQIRQRGFMQEIYYRREKNLVSARIWYQSAYRNLPSSMLSQQVNSGEKQSDESLKAMFNYNYSGSKNEYFFTGAWLLNRLNYSNRLASIDSRNTSETFILKAGIESWLGDHTKLKVNLNEELNVIKSNNYDHNATRNNTTVTASAERNSNRLGTMILFRESFNNNAFLIPDFSAAFQFRILDAKEYFLKANISRNSKIPAMNDIFWVPGGNPDLKNEYAFTYELTYNMNQKVSSPLTLNYNLTIFRNNIKDMIQWHPGEFSYWTADNIKNVNSIGLESSLHLDYKVNNFKTVFNTGYTFTKAASGGSGSNYDTSGGKQLIYIPENSANTSICFSYRDFYSSWVTIFTGRRYITTDNSRYLPAYLLNNFLAGIKLNLKRNSLDMNFNIENLFDVNYQTIAYFPLPGRTFSIKILLQLVK